MTTVTETTRYGTATAMAWGQLHQRPASRGGWEGHDGELAVIAGTPIRLQAGYLPGDRSPDPLWLWSSRGRTSAGEVDHTWQAFLRRFDSEHMFRLFKQALGWTRPKLRDPAAADRWTWLIIACHAQLRLARTLAEDLRLPWQRPCPPGRPTPARVRRGFRNIHQTLPGLASAPKPGKPGSGRPPDQRTATRPPATTSAGPSNAPSPRRNRQAERLNNRLRADIYGHRPTNFRATLCMSRSPPNVTFAFRQVACVAPDRGALP